MDQQNDRGIHFVLRYVGSISINVSMKTLEYSVRSDLTKECVYRVCEAAHMITETKRKIGKNIRDCLPGPPNLENGGENVYLSVSTRHFVVSCLSNPKILFEHPIADISFAVAGDEETADFVAYVGKCKKFGRRCYVFECQAGRTQDVFSTIRQAFEMRFEQVTSTPVATINAPALRRESSATATGGNANQNSNLAMATAGDGVRYNQAPEPPPRVTLASSSPRSPVLIDLNSPTQPPPNSYVNTSEQRFFGGSEPPAPLLPCRKDLEAEPWYHGRMSREDSERLLKNNGEFLVRISPKDPHQIILTGVQNGVHKHLMLIDEEGKVRTKDREFESVSHLIQHHRTSNLPITSAESALMLQFPINRN